MSIYFGKDDWSKEKKAKFAKLAEELEKMEDEFLGLCGLEKHTYWCKFGMHPNYGELDNMKKLRPDLYELAMKISNLMKKLEKLGAGVVMPL